MAVNTYGSYLMKGTGSGTLTWEKLIDIVDYPSMIEAPEQLDATTLSNSMRVYIPGIKDVNGALEFQANYSPNDFGAIQALEGVEGDFAVWFGEADGVPDGHLGKFTFKGYPFASKDGGGVNEVSHMTVGIVPSSEIAFSAN